ncbi:MAG: NAD(P)/FAD-dependent oxidoreductase, partial [Bacteroidia bacterium]|nr:NAD(P)/FAD-dependent oxidoreductase [Bacteroidia bacterium]
MNSFDLVVIGGGPSGYAAAIRALDLRKKVLLVEKSRIGGAGIWEGALSSKTLWEISRDVKRLRNQDRGYCVSNFDLNFSAVRSAMMDAVQSRADQLSAQLQAFLEKTDLLRYEIAHGKIHTPHSVELVYSDGKSEIVQTEYILLATGSSPRVLPHIPIDNINTFTSDGIHYLDDFPESLVILGAGVIGCEFATIFANFGKTKVYIIEKGDRIIGFEDPDISSVVESNLQAAGVTIHKNATVEYLKSTASGVEYCLKFKNGECQIFSASKALVSVGRTPNIENLGVENVGVALKESGCFIVDGNGRTNIPSIFAVGDLTADICLVNVGELEGRHAVEVMFGVCSEPMSYNNIATIMFLAPEVAGVGMNELEAQKKQIPYRVAKYDYQYISRAIAMRNAQGFFKVLVSDDDEMKILGMRAIGE